jgi:FKBP-type peptidyl-prolyl cis-trans isomerase
MRLLMCAIAALGLLSACGQDSGVMRELERMERAAKELDAKRAPERLATTSLFDAKDAAAQGVKTTPSGLRYRVLKSGAAAAPLTRETDMVSVHYEGWLKNGAVFDSSYARGEPVQFTPQQVIPAWTEALQMMRPGDQWEIYAPSNIAYGPMPPSPDIPPNADLIFRMEIVENHSQR